VTATDRAARRAHRLGLTEAAPAATTTRRPHRLALTEAAHARAAGLEPSARIEAGGRWFARLERPR
jgi:hypothetical protein